MWAISFKDNIQQRDMAKAKAAKANPARRGSVQPGAAALTKEPSWAKRKSAPDALA
jgi:hypothetical protein